MSSSKFIPADAPASMQIDHPLYLEISRNLLFRAPASQVENDIAAINHYRAFRAIADDRGIDPNSFEGTMLLRSGLTPSPIPPGWLPDADVL